MTALILGGNSMVETQDFTPTRTIHVSPTASINGTGTPEDPMRLLSAIKASQPGDLVLLHAGDYPGGWFINRAGTSENPIVYRAAPGERARIIGVIRLLAPFNWIWGLEITDPDNIAPFHDGVGVYTSNVRLINNVIHHHCNDNGLGAWNTGEGQVYYGNIIYMNGCNPTMTPDGSRLRHPHNVYTQNDFETNGLKYFVGNIILDEGCSNGCNSVAAYTQEGQISGYVVEDNIFANGVVLHGGYAPAGNIAYRNNAFYNAQMRFGYRDPVQFEFTGNYMGNSRFTTEWFWADDSYKTGTNVVTDNTFVSVELSFQTAQVRRTLDPGEAPIDTSDIWDRNTYIGSFNGRIAANQESGGFDSVDEWQALTDSAGNPFDRRSDVQPEATQPYVILYPNEYEPDTVYIAVYNWSNASSVTVDLPGSQVVYNARDLFGTPVAVGANVIHIPMTETFGAFVACEWGEGSGGCQ